MTTPNWDKAPEGYPIWIESKKRGERHGWHREEDSGYRDTSGLLWMKEDEDTDYVVHRPPAWNGVGNPPAGIECEWLQFVHPSIHYVRVKVIGPDEGGVVFRITEGSSKGGYQVCGQATLPNGGPVFRPLLTAEQMAAKQRREKINKIMADAGIWDSAYKDDPEAHLWAMALVDKGYEPPKEKAEC